MKIIKVTSSPIEGVAYVLFTNNSGLEFTCWADEAKTYESEKEAELEITAIKEKEKGLYYEIVDREKEIKETIPSWLNRN